MTLRDNLSQRKRMAHQILDQVRAGIEVPKTQVQWALIILGDVA